MVFPVFFFLEGFVGVFIGFYRVSSVFSCFFFFWVNCLSWFLGFLVFFLRFLVLF